MPGDRQDTSQTEAWARVYDELRTQQSLASVINDPRGNRLLRGQWDGLGEFVDTVRESVEELNEPREEGIDPTRLARLDALLGEVPEVADFQPYLDTFDDLWDVYYRNRRTKSRPAGATAVGSPSPEDDFSREAHHGVPPEYFSSSFSLEQHQILRLSLEAVVERQEDLNEELLGYMDLVEVSLFEHIRKAQREHLFDSLALLGEPLQQDLSGAAGVIHTLRQHLNKVKQRQLDCGLAVGRLARRKRRVQEVLRRLDCLEHVRQCRPSIQMLLQGRDFMTALHLIDSATSAMDANLKGVVSVKTLWTQLADLGNTFDRAVEAEFVHLSSEVLLNINGEEDHMRLRHLCQCLASRDCLRAALNPTLRGVVLSQMKKAIRQHAKMLLQEFGEGAAEVAGAGEAGEDEKPELHDQDQNDQNGKETPRPEGDADGQVPPAKEGLGISASLCVLTFEHFMEFWQKLLELVALTGSRFTDYAFLVHQVAHETECSVDRGHEVSLELQHMLEVLLAQAFKIAGALLQARQEEHQRLKMAEWRSFLQLTDDLIQKVQHVQRSCQSKIQLDGRVGEIQAGLLAITYSHTKSIIEEFHQKCLLQTKQVLEQERWERTDVPIQYKKILNTLLGHEEEEMGDDANPPPERYLHVEGSHYLVIPAVLTLLQLLAEYIDIIRLCRDFNDMTAEVVQRMCQLLRVFNQKAKRLVLDGQAVKQHKVLRNITAANLALSSQCCGLMAQILPLLQTRLTSDESRGRDTQTAQSTAKEALVVALVGDLSKIGFEFAEHRSALFGKLSDLLRVHYEKHSQRWLKVPHSEGPDIWKEDAMATLQSECALGEHESLEGLVKDITAMYKILLRNLNYDSVRKIFARAFEEMASSFQQRLEQEVSAPSPPYSEGLGRSLGDRLLLDLAYLYRELQQLTGITTPLQRLLCDLVQHLQTKLPEDAPRKIHSVVLEALQRAGRLPQ